MAFLAPGRACVPKTAGEVKLREWKAVHSLAHHWFVGEHVAQHVLGGAGDLHMALNGVEQLAP